MIIMDIESSDLLVSINNELKKRLKRLEFI